MLDIEISNEVATRIAEIGRQVAVPRKLTREECTTPELRMEYIAQWLEAGAPHECGIDGFDMREPKMMTECGTVCCIAGAACQFFDGKVPSTSPLPNGEGDWMDRAHLLLGMDEENAFVMFIPDGLSDHIYTPAWAARCIRKYQREGVVDWEGTRDA